MLEEFLQGLRIPERFLSEREVVEAYVDMGSKVGCALCLKSVNGLRAEFIDDLRSLKRWEREYAFRGYQPIDLKLF